MAPATKQRDYDYLFKLVLIGDSGVGKSCLLLRFAVSTVLYPTSFDVLCHSVVQDVCVECEWASLVSYPDFHNVRNASCVLSKYLFSYIYILYAYNMYSFIHKYTFANSHLSCFYRLQNGTCIPSPPSTTTTYKLQITHYTISNKKLHLCQLP